MSSGLISILLPDLRGGGAERLNLDLAYEFARAGHEVEFVLMRAEGEWLAEARAAFAIVDLQCSRIRQLPLALARYVRARRPDALLAAMWPLTAIAGLTLRLAGLPTRLVVSEHNDFRNIPSIKPIERRMLALMGRWLYGRAGKVVAVSRGVADSLRTAAGLGADRIQVIYNPVRPLVSEPTEPADADLLGWWGEADLKIIAVGSLKPQKDYPTLLKAMGRLRDDIDARLLVLGDGPERPALNRLASMESLENGVRFAGFRSSPYPYLQTADLFVLSSRWEGLGNVIIEALLCGCRVVATDCPSGPAELLADGRFGRLVPVGDPDELAAAMAESALAPHDCGPGIAWASRFTSQASAQAYLNLLFPTAPHGPGVARS